LKYSIWIPSLAYSRFCTSSRCRTSSLWDNVSLVFSII